MYGMHHREARRRLSQVPCYSGAVPRTNSLTVIDVHSTVLFCTTIYFIFPGKHLYLPLPSTFKFSIICIIITSTVLLFTYVCVVMYNFVISYNGKKNQNI